MCFESGPLGGAEVDTGVLFADMRGFTSLSEGRSPEDMAHLLNRFYRAAREALIDRGAIVDKLVGDQVMALFVPGLAGPSYLEKMADAAEDLLQRVGYTAGEQPWLAVGVGLDCGLAFVGNLGSGEVKDFTAIGDVVNTAARLQAQAQAGQIVVSERFYQRLPGRYPDARPVELDLKGKAEPVPARIIDLARTPAVA
jgi:adenylate cyclase